MPCAAVEFTWPIKSAPRSRFCIAVFLATTPAAMLGNLHVLFFGDALSRASREKLEEWLAVNTTGRELIRAGLPNDWKIGDKTGRGTSGATNDVAIPRPPEKPPVMVAVYFGGSTALSRRSDGGHP